MIRLLPIAAALAVAAPAAVKGEVAHPHLLFHMVQAEVDYARDGGSDRLSWEADAWIGGDVDKFWLKSEGEVEGGDAEEAEVQALYSRAVSTFFDAQLGVRYDVEPRGTAYAVVGVQGLAPYFFETSLAAFISERGDVSARVEQSVDLLLTQRLVLEPHLEANVQFQDVPAERIGAGLSDIEAGLQLRYEITRKFAPYVDLGYERLFGETRRLARADGEQAGNWLVKAGVRFWF